METNKIFVKSNQVETNKIPIKLKQSLPLITPKLVKLQKKKGIIVNPYDIYIGRRINNPNWRLEDSIWANPFVINKDRSREQVIELYRKYLMKDPEVLKLLPKSHKGPPDLHLLKNLSGKVLGCWCCPEHCHGDILIELFNEKIWEKI